MKESSVVLKHCEEVLASGPPGQVLSEGDFANASKAMRQLCLLAITLDPKVNRSGVSDCALSEIFKMQRRTELVIDEDAFDRLVAEIAQDFKTDLQFEPAAMEAMQLSAERSCCVGGFFCLISSFVLQVSCRNV